MTTLNNYIDHTLLKPSATQADIVQLCEEAKTHKFYAVCVQPCNVELAKTLLTNTSVKICTVIGFPLGASHTKTKVFETKLAIEQGAREIDMVINIGFLKSRNYNAVFRDIDAVKKACGKLPLKVILETSELTKGEIIYACEIAMKAKADFVKTSTGFSKRGATYADVKIMKKTLKNELKIKASGGIRDYDTAMHFINLGVQRIGTSSGVKLLKQQELH